MSTAKKEYKSAGDRKKHRHSKINVKPRGLKNSNGSKKKKLSKKNAHFLEGLGLKVKQNP